MVSHDIFTGKIVHNNACAIYRLAIKACITIYRISCFTRSMIGQLSCLYQAMYANKVVTPQHISSVIEDKKLDRIITTLTPDENSRLE